MTNYKLIGEVTFSQAFQNEVVQLGSDTSYFEELCEAVEDDFEDTMGPSGLAEYLDYEYEKLEDGIINSIMVTVAIKNNKVISIAEVKANRELTPSELEIIKEYISGQYSDGWGEGFEQHAIKYVDEEVEYEDYDEEDGSVNIEYETEQTEIYAHFWDGDTEYTWQ